MPFNTRFVLDRIADTITSKGLWQTNFQGDLYVRVDQYAFVSPSAPGVLPGVVPALDDEIQLRVDTLWFLRAVSDEIEYYRTVFARVEFPVHIDKFLRLLMEHIPWDRAGRDTGMGYQRADYDTYAFFLYGGPTPAATKLPTSPSSPRAVFHV
jgi:hypothetical protein